MQSLFIGLMSGTSLDGVDGVLTDLTQPGQAKVIASAYLPFDDELRSQFLALQQPGDNELAREAQAANQLSRSYASCVAALLRQAGVSAQAITALGAHGQTLRHQPQQGYTWQSLNPALLAELTGIDVVADFRSRDIAANGQGAPLVPAFHAAMFRVIDQTRVILNIGGIANLTVLPPLRKGQVQGWDTGPGNMLMDAWIQRHLQRPFDSGGSWAASGQLIEPLLKAMLDDPYFSKRPPKSTGRDQFHLDWLTGLLNNHAPLAHAADVQATLCELTAQSIVNEISQVNGLLGDTIASSTAHLVGLSSVALAVYACGGGAHNKWLLQRIQSRLGDAIPLMNTEELGVAVNHVEALAFAWLARQCVMGEPGNLVEVTGASGPRILGALYPR
ncbi:anhydro-N-acetylmuramic acid kinase [Ampullimonas aquatilis]|uniref:anhydro-N-acetylmuramic acid kinase n=1 Tax=Ampullimonas aquatilis TaxID=1341549 RepID=UPI003C710BD1